MRNRNPSEKAPHQRHPRDLECRRWLCGIVNNLRDFRNIELASHAALTELVDREKREQHHATDTEARGVCMSSKAHERSPGEVRTRWMVYLHPKKLMFRSMQSGKTKTPTTNRRQLVPSAKMLSSEVPRDTLILNTRAAADVSGIIHCGSCDTKAHSGMTSRIMFM